jgi:hypothetical protein
MRGAADLQRLMLWYSFTAVWPGGKSSLADAARFSDDDQARQHARRLVRELKTHPDYDDPHLRIIVLSDVGNAIIDW